MTTYTTRQLGQALDISYVAACTLAGRLASVWGWREVVGSGNRYAWTHEEVLALLILRECPGLGNRLAVWLHDVLPATLERSPHRWLVLPLDPRAGQPILSATDETLVRVLAESGGLVVLDTKLAREKLAERLGG